MMSEVDALVKKGISAYKGGDAAEAQQLLLKAVELDEHNEKAWLWLSGAVESDEDRRVCLENVLAINPDNTAARKGLAKLPPAEDEPPTPIEPAPEAVGIEKNGESVAAVGAPGSSSDQWFAATDYWTEEEPAGEEEAAEVVPPWVQQDVSGWADQDDSAGDLNQEPASEQEGAEQFPSWVDVVGFEESEPGVPLADEAGDSWEEAPAEEPMSFPWDERAEGDDSPEAAWRDEGPESEPEPEPQSFTTGDQYTPQFLPEESVTSPQAEFAIESPDESEATPSTPTRQRPAPKKKAAAGKRNTDTILLIGAVGFLLLVIFVAVAALLVPRLLSAAEAGTPKATPVPAVDDESQVVLSVLRENVAAYNVQDLDRYMATIHSAAPGYNETRSALEEMADLFELSANWDRMEIETISDREATVAFALTTKKISGPAFRDNRIEGVMRLRPDDGVWKIYDQRVDDIEYLN